MSDQTPPVVYQADPVSGEYVGKSFADPDPMDANNWLIPGMAFLDAPPEPKKGFAIVRPPESGSTWMLVEDLRGVAYRTDSGAAVEWAIFGQLCDGLTQVPRPSAYHIWEDGAWRLDEVAEAKALKLQAENKRDELLQQAAIRIAPLQDAADLGEATDADTANLALWRRYRIAVNRVPDQPKFPSTISWPSPPFE